MHTSGRLTLDLKIPLGGPIGSQTTSNSHEWLCECWGRIIGHKLGYIRHGGMHGGVGVALGIHKWSKSAKNT